MPGVPDRPLPRVTIVSLSNSQSYCDKNALLNAMFQDYPHARLEFIMLEVRFNSHLSLFYFYFSAAATGFTAAHAHALVTSFHSTTGIFL